MGNRAAGAYATCIVRLRGIGGVRSHPIFCNERQDGAHVVSRGHHPDLETLLRFLGGVSCLLHRRRRIPIPPMLCNISISHVRYRCLVLPLHDRSSLVFTSRTMASVHSETRLKHELMEAFLSRLQVHSSFARFHPSAKPTFTKCAAHHDCTHICALYATVSQQFVAFYCTVHHRKDAQHSRGGCLGG